MVGMGMRLKLPVNGQTFALHIVDNGLRRSMGRTPGGSIIIKHRVDNSRVLRDRTMDDMRSGVRRFIKKRTDHRSGGRAFFGAPDLAGCGLDCCIMHGVHLLAVGCLYDTFINC